MAETHGSPSIPPVGAWGYGAMAAYLGVWDEQLQLK